MRAKNVAAMTDKAPADFCIVDAAPAKIEVALGATEEDTGVAGPVRFETGEVGVAEDEESNTVVLIVATAVEVLFWTTGSATGDAVIAGTTGATAEADGHGGALREIGRHSAWFPVSSL